MPARKRLTSMSAKSRITKPKARPPKAAERKAIPFAAAFAPRAPGERRYWLVKSEPEAFGWEQLEGAPGRTTCWDGVRNYQARNFMRDGMRAGDGVLFYHSNAEPPAVVGVCEVVREAYPDHTALDARDPHFDPKSRAEAPTWLMVDLRAVERLARPVTLPMLREAPGLEGMELLRRGSRLSVQPVEAGHWATVLRLGRGR